MDTVGVRVEAQGEQAFKQSLANINAGLKVNASEMAMVTAEYGKNEKSIEALNAKSNALKNQIASQADKVNLLVNALQKSAATTGESSARTMKLQADYNNARAALTGMNKELAANDQALERAQKKSRSLADAVNSIVQMTGVQLPPAMQGMISKLDNVSASGAALVGVLAGVTVGLGKMAMKTAKTADDLVTLSTQTGISTKTLQEFQYSSELLDVSTDTLTKSMAKMVRTMDSARDGTKQTSDAYQALGVNVTDSSGKLRDNETVFYEVIDALGQIGDTTERDAIAMQIFGKSAQDLNPLIVAGSDQMRALAEEANKVGYVMSEDTLASFLELSDASERMNKQMDALKNSLAMALLPVLTQLFTAIAAVPVPVLQTIIVLTTTIATILLIVKSIKEMTATASAIKGFFTAFDIQTAKTTAMIIGTVAAVVALVAMIVVLTGKKNELEQVADSVNRTMSNVRGDVSAAQGRTNMRGYARGTISALPGWALVGENGPEYVKLNGGERVFNAQETRQMQLAAPAGSTTNQYTYNITIDAKNVKEFNDIVRMAERARQDRRAR